MGKSSRPAQEKSSNDAGYDGQARSDLRGRNHAEVPYPGSFTCMICSFTECVFSRFSNHCMKHGLHLELHCSICTKMFPSIYSVACHYSRCAKTLRKPGTSKNPSVSQTAVLNINDLAENKGISKNKEIPENNRRVTKAKVIRSTIDLNNKERSISNKEALENNRMVTRLTIKRATAAESRSAPPLLNRTPAECPEVSIVPLVCTTIDNNRRQTSKAASAPLNNFGICQPLFEETADRVAVVTRNCAHSEIKEMPPARLNMRLRTKTACGNIPESPRLPEISRTASENADETQGSPGISAVATRTRRTNNNAPTLERTHSMHVCTVCSRVFNSFPELRLHEKTAHPANFSASSQKSVKHQWTIDHLREVKEVEEELAANNSRQ
ncbi:hypothetical protein T12_1604 [Trichinella patagoniensis]|uniref:C2H2-type domain-containing protein n=1 Tax=Trichinella patagoniensis TaxID=990121 RepID=A0A0V0Z6I4_9BILA|nr:hypothetical protein T12_1604 [Trichinella patagoniensis]